MPRLWGPTWGSDPMLIGDSLAIAITLSFMGHLLGNMGLYCDSHHLPVSWFLLYIISCRRSLFFWKNFLAALGLHCCLWAFSSCWQWGLLSGCGAQASHCRRFSCCRTQALRACGLSSSSLRALQHGLSSCGSQTQLPLGVWNLPGPGIEPVSHTLAGGLILRH